MTTKFYNTPANKNIRKNLRKEMPKGEKLLWFRLKNKKLGYKFRRQYGIDNYIVDFYCIKLKLAIEIDGRTHDYDDSIIYDKERQKYLESLGIMIKRFDSGSVFEDLDYVVNCIKNVCDGLSKQ